jgi:hypothetical protein
VKLEEYVRMLQQILAKEGDIEVLEQTLTHTFPADRPAIKEDRQKRKYLIINP